MASSTKNVKLGVCNALFDGIDLGLTKGGVEVEVTTSTHEIVVDQFGDTPIGELITGRKVTAKVPLAETTLENLVRIMPGAELITDGAKATGTITFVTAAPSNNDAVTLDGVKYTFKTTPVDANDMPIPATFTEAAVLIANKIDTSNTGYDASASAGVVTVTALARGVAGNVTMTKTAGTNITVTGLTGGIDVTKAQVVVSTGVNINLLDLAKVLVLRPRGTTGADDFTIFNAMCPGGLNFTYATDNERIYAADFKGYVDGNGSLFSVGDVAAV